ncbi:hypothetical protein AB2359_17565, partial [Vibrio cholerae]|uniref:hypothetical protein n=1 Tax=Vibrio cholerae TaxID=666 RepID=UPI003F9A4EB8
CVASPLGGRYATENKELKLGLSLKRYTELPFLIDMLVTKEMALLNPETWDDRNDSFYIKQYAKVKGLKSTYALCLTEASETYHHWKIFSSGTSGIYVEFNRDQLLTSLENQTDLQTKSVEYKKITELREINPETDEFPFLKRIVFKDEQEFRLFVGSDTDLGPILRLKFDLASINRIVLSPWLPQSVADHVKSVIKNISGCSNIKVYRSTLVENEDWKSFAESVA